MAAPSALSTVQIAPRVLTNGVSDLSRAVAYLASHEGPAAQLAEGTVPFRPERLPPGI